MRHVRALFLCALATGCATSAQGNGRRAEQQSAARGDVAGDDTAGAPVRIQSMEGLQSVAVVNDVSSCVALTPEKLIGVGSVAIGIYGLTHLKPLGECGCMSSTLGYRVLQKQEEPAGELPPGVPALDPIQRAFGSVDVTQRMRSLSVVVSPDQELYGLASLTFAIGCLGPE